MKQARKKTKITTGIDTINRERDHGYLKIGSILSINRYQLNCSTWRSREETPTLYGIIENPCWYDTQDSQTISDEENYVTFVVSEQLEWLDTREMNVRREKGLRADLTLESLPPQRTNE